MAIRAGQRPCSHSWPLVLQQPQEETLSSKMMCGEVRLPMRFEKEANTQHDLGRVSLVTNTASREDIHCSPTHPLSCVYSKSGQRHRQNATLVEVV